MSVDVNFSEIFFFVEKQESVDFFKFTFGDLHNILKIFV